MIYITSLSVQCTVYSVQCTVKLYPVEWTLRKVEKHRTSPKNGQKKWVKECGTPNGGQYGSKQKCLVP